MSRYGSAQIRSTDFAGEVLTPGMDGYAEAAATVFATGTPDVVVRPADAGEVAAALRYAAEGGLTVSVRSGGHSVAGLSTHADGMVIDLRRISRVEVIDQATGASASAQERPGARWPLPCSHTGSASRPATPTR